MKPLDLLEASASLQFDTKSRCFIGHKVKGGGWEWQEVSAITYGLLCGELQQLSGLGSVRVEGEVDDMSIMEINPPAYFLAKCFHDDPLQHVPDWDQALLGAICR